MFTSIHHVAFIVHDLDPWSEQFERLAGVEVASVDRLSGEFNLEVAVFFIGETMLELVTPTSADGWARNHLDEHGEGLFHIAFEVDDIDASMRRLEAHGYAFPENAPREGVDWLVATIDSSDTLFTTQLVEDPRTPEERRRSLKR